MPLFFFFFIKKKNVHYVFGTTLITNNICPLAGQWTSRQTTKKCALLFQKIAKKKVTIALTYILIKPKITFVYKKSANVRKLKLVCAQHMTMNGHGGSGRESCPRQKISCIRLQ